jgi:hypothetical protein
MQLGVGGEHGSGSMPGFIYRLKGLRKGLPSPCVAARGFLNWIRPLHGPIHQEEAHDHAHQSRCNRGVVFEDYDFPNLKTVEHVCVLGSEKAAWFKDTEGNYLCVHEGPH